MTVEILNPGIFASMQGNERLGFQALGVPPCGPMDSVALWIANLLVGNEIDEACIEFGLHGASVFFHDDAVIALAGSGARARIENDEVPFNRTLLFRKSQTLNLVASGAGGMWSYLAIAGGFDVAKVMGSYSTYIPAGLGGFGRALVKGDAVQVKNKGKRSQKILASFKNSEKFSVANWHLQVPQQNNSNFVRVIEGCEWNFLTEESKQTFQATSFQVSSDSNRIGYRLISESLPRVDAHELISSPVSMGTIQLTNDGQLIVLMADSQTVGGYPRIAHVVAVDIPKLAQTRPNSTIHFKIISIQEAERLLLERDRFIRNLQLSVKQKFTE